MRLTDQEAEAVGHWIADARKRLHGWRQEDLAAASRLSKSNLSNIETGKQGTKGWNVSTIQAIEDALQVAPGTLRRVAAGEKLAPEDVRETAADGRLLGQISQLVDQVEALRRRVESLETRDE